ncbi:MAG: hypothetical protein JW895_18260 [Thermoleophilaceae bacterium]|nr:hypothetical protein [Thermoleophilaceae bacterium]
MTPIALSTVGLIFLVIAGVMVVFFIGGLIAVYVRSQREAGVYEEHVREADQALERARAGDRGWDRDVMESVVRSALSAQRPDFSYAGLHLVLVEDRPGQDEDRAHFVALGDGGETRVVLGRQGGDWVAESVG